MSGNRTRNRQWLPSSLFYKYCFESLYLHILDQNACFLTWSKYMMETPLGLNSVMGQFDSADNLTPTMQGGQFDTADNLTPRTIWHHHKFHISTIVWPQNMIRNILIATIYLFDWKLSCIMSLYQIRARQGPHIKTYLISWQLFGPKISLEIHCWPITTFFKTVG